MTTATTEPLEARRLLAAGELDPAFGDAGPVSVGPPGVARAVVADATGRVYVAAEEATAGGADLFLARFLPGGQGDTSFSGDGEVRIDLGGDDRPLALALAPDGKLLVLGSSFSAQQVETVFLARYLPNGTRDAAFGSNGFAYLPPNVFASAMAVSGAGDIFLAGGEGVRGDSSARVIKYVIDGVPDNNFGDAGISLPPQIDLGEYTDVVIQGGQVVAVGGPGASAGVQRFTSSGAPDANFGPTAGVAFITEFSQGVFGVEAQGDGRLVVMGVNSNGTFVLRRLDADGALDPTFGDGTALDTSIPANFARSAQQLAVGAGGTIVVAGDSPDGGALNGVRVNRYTPDGLIDPTFGPGGSASFSAAIGSFFPRAVGLQPPGPSAPVGAAENIIVVGTNAPETGGNAVAIRVLGFDPPPFAFLDPRSGLLNVNGGDAGDELFIDSAGGGASVVAQLGADSLFFPTTAVQRVELRTGGGSDRVTVGAGVAVPMRVELGGGNNRFSYAGNAPATILGGGGRDTVLAGAGDDLIQTFGGSDLIQSGAGNDTVDTGSGGDSVDGGAGNDSLLGGDGGDNLAGADGNDTLVGRAGDDVLMGGPGADRLFGEAGNDALMGGGGNDRVFGGDDNDELSGSAGNDTLDGGAGFDRLFGGDGADALQGGAGGDTLDGQRGNDQLFGGDGNDLLLSDLDAAAQDTLDGGGGFDAVRADAGDVLTACELRYRIRRL